MFKFIVNLFSVTKPPLGVWIPYNDWLAHPEWRDHYSIVDYDRARNYIKVGY